MACGLDTQIKNGGALLTKGTLKEHQSPKLGYPRNNDRIVNDHLLGKTDMLNTTDGGLLSNHGTKINKNISINSLFLLIMRMTLLPK